MAYNLSEKKTYLRNEHGIDIDIITCFTYASRNRKAYMWRIYGPTTGNEHELVIIGESYLMNIHYENALNEAVECAIKYLKENEQET